MIKIHCCSFVLGKPEEGKSSCCQIRSRVQRFSDEDIEDVSGSKVIFLNADLLYK